MLLQIKLSLQFSSSTSFLVNMDNPNSKISKSEWNTPILIDILKLPNQQEHKIASLQNKILNLTDAKKKGLKKERITHYGPLLWLFVLWLCLRYHLPPYFLYYLYLFYTLSSHIQILLPNFLFTLKFSLPHFSLNLSEPAPLKLRLLIIQRLNC